MGMFDYVRVDVPLPDGLVWPEHSLQSKDGDCTMSILWITADGRVLQEKIRTESVPEEERPEPCANGSFGGALGSLFGIFRSVHDGWEDMEHHGYIDFYGSQEDNSSFRVKRKWHNYRAKFTDGKLVGITVNTEVL